MREGETSYGYNGTCTMKNCRRAAVSSAAQKKAEKASRPPELIQGPGVLPKRRGKQVVKRERGREVHVG